MEIQYAIFCEQVKFPESTRGKILLTQPITSPTITTNSKTTTAQLNLPLFITFINGASPITHNLEVKVTTSLGGLTVIKDFNFDWSGKTAVQAHCFIVILPKIQVPNTIHFTLYLDGEEQCQIKVPIKTAERHKK
jgi:hypothetical protein